MKKFLHWLARGGRKLVILSIGSIVVSIGIAMLFLPGPAFIVIPLGLSILATEFVWARKLLDKIKKFFAKQIKKYKNKKSNR